MQFIPEEKEEMIKRGKRKVGGKKVRKRGKGKEKRGQGKKTGLKGVFTFFYAEGIFLGAIRSASRSKNLLRQKKHKSRFFA